MAVNFCPGLSVSMSRLSLLFRHWITDTGKSVSYTYEITRGEPQILEEWHKSKDTYKTLCHLHKHIWPTDGSRYDHKRTAKTCDWKSCMNCCVCLDVELVPFGIMCAVSEDTQSSYDLGQSSLKMLFTPCFQRPPSIFNHIHALRLA